ncbi:hypothetical protein [Natronospira sp.]|uniref:hypothetical protein n=1 Tax=Natronospira sp. TaxID=2024970 RepID=UPI003872ED8A
MAMATSTLESLLADVMGEAERMERLRYRRNTGPAPRRWSGQMRIVLSMARQDGNALDFLHALHNMLRSGHYSADDIWQFRCLMHERPNGPCLPRDEICQAMENSKDRWDWSSEVPNEGLTALTDLRLYRALKNETLETLFFEALLCDQMTPGQVALLAAAFREVPDDPWLRSLLHEKLATLHFSFDAQHPDGVERFQDSLRASFHESVTHQPLMSLANSVLEAGDTGLVVQLIRGLRNNPATVPSVDCLARLLAAGHKEARAALISIGIHSQGKVPADVTGRALSLGLSS